MSTQATIRTIGAGNHFHAIVKFNAKYLAASCGVCGASKGSKCRGRHGAALASMHMERKERWVAMQKAVSA